MKLKHGLKVQTGPTQTNACCFVVCSCACGKHSLCQQREDSLYDVKAKKKKTVKLSRNRPWRPIGLEDVEDPTLTRQSPHRWR
jgi:hypothetical protein